MEAPLTSTVGSPVAAGLDAGRGCIGCGALCGAFCESCGAVQNVGPYQTLQVLQQTRRGRTYLAHDGTQRWAVLLERVLDSGVAPTFLEAFERDARILKQLRHPRMPRMLGSFKIPSPGSLRVYVAQEFVGGPTLTEELSNRRFDESDVLDIARQLLETLLFIHQRTPPIPHRDIKPANLVRRNDGRVVLVGHDLLRGAFDLEAVDGTRVDLRGLGRTLVELLTGLPPERLIGKSGEVEFDREVTVSTGTEDFLRRLLSDQTGRTFSSVEEALAALSSPIGVPVSGETASNAEEEITTPSFGTRLPANVVRFDKRWLWPPRRPVEPELQQEPTPLPRKVIVGGAAASNEALPPYQASGTDGWAKFALVFLPFATMGALLALNALLHGALFSWLR